MYFSEEIREMWLFLIQGVTIYFQWREQGDGVFSHYWHERLNVAKCQTYSQIITGIYSKYCTQIFEISQKSIANEKYCLIKMLKEVNFTSSKIFSLLGKAILTVLWCFQECFPQHIHTAFLIKPEKFWEKQKTSLGSAKYKFEVSICQSWQSGCYGRAFKRRDIS